jgi:hypothetical protein
VDAAVVNEERSAEDGDGGEAGGQGEAALVSN